MPGITPGTADAAELLQLLAGWLAADPATLSPYRCSPTSAIPPTG
jgi:hypothetical protein